LSAAHRKLHKLKTELAERTGPPPVSWSGAGIYGKSSVRSGYCRNCLSSLQRMPARRAMQGPASTLGLKWKAVGAQKPTKGQEIENDALAEKLRQRLDLTEEELDGFQIHISYDSCVQSGGCWFTPQADASTDDLHVRRCMRSQSRFSDCIGVACHCRCVQRC